MEYKDIVCYECIDNGRNTVSLRSLVYREGFSITDLFYAVHDSYDYDDLLRRVNRVVAIPFLEEKRNDKYYLLKNDNDIFLKVKNCSLNK